MTVRVVLRPRPNGRLYDVTFEGELLVSASADPEHDAARALLSKGITGTAETIDSATAKVRLRFDIKDFAKTPAVERDAGGITTEPWRPRPPEISHRRSGKRDSEVGDTQRANDERNARTTSGGRTP